MIRCYLLCFGIISSTTYANATVSTSEKELLQPISIDDVKPAKGQSYEAVPSGWRAFGSTMTVVGLACGALWAFRKYGSKRLPGSGGNRIKVEETLALGEKRFVSILKADEEKFLIALSPQGITLLARLDNLEMPVQGNFVNAFEDHVGSVRPVPVKEMEALISGGRNEY